MQKSSDFKNRIRQVRSSYHIIFKYLLQKRRKIKESINNAKRIKINFFCVKKIYENRSQHYEIKIL